MFVVLGIGSGERPTLYGGNLMPEAHQVAISKILSANFFRDYFLKISPFIVDTNVVEIMTHLQMLSLLREEYTYFLYRQFYGRIMKTGRSDPKTEFITKESFY